MNVDIRLCDANENPVRVYEQIAALIRAERPSSGTPSLAAIARIAREDKWILAYLGDELVGVLHLRILPTVYEDQFEGRIERVTMAFKESHRNAFAIDGLLKRAIAVARRVPVTHIDAKNPAPCFNQGPWFLSNGFAPADVNNYRIAWSREARTAALAATQASVPTA